MKIPYRELIEAVSSWDIITNINLVKANISIVGARLNDIESTIAWTLCDINILHDVQAINTYADKCISDTIKIVDSFEIITRNTNNENINGQNINVPTIRQGVRDIRLELSDLIPRSRDLLSHCSRELVNV